MNDKQKKAMIIIIYVGLFIISIYLIIYGLFIAPNDPQRICINNGGVWNITQGICLDFKK